MSDSNDVGVADNDTETIVTTQTAPRSTTAVDTPHQAAAALSCHHSQ